MNINSIKGGFVCNKCRRECSDGEDSVGPFGPNNCALAYPGRKIEITCLGPLCDEPCDLRKEECEVTKEILCYKIRYLTSELNKIHLKD